MHSNKQMSFESKQIFSCVTFLNNKRENILLLAELIGSFSPIFSHLISIFF